MGFLLVCIFFLFLNFLFLNFGVAFGLVFQLAGGQQDVVPREEFLYVGGMNALAVVVRQYFAKPLAKSFIVGFLYIPCQVFAAL